MKKTNKIIATLTALALCLAVGCGGADEQEPRAPQLVEIETHKVFAKYDEASDSYWVLGYQTHIPADLLLPILNGRVSADWGTSNEGLADEQRPFTRPLPDERSLDQARK